MIFLKEVWLLLHMMTTKTAARNIHVAHACLYSRYKNMDAHQNREAHRHVVWLQNILRVPSKEANQSHTCVSRSGIAML